MKVSLALTQGTSTSVFGGLSHAGGQTGVFGGAAVSQTALAKSLAPPKEPSEGGNSHGCLYVLGLFLVFWIAMVIVGSSTKDQDTLSKFGLAGMFVCFVGAVLIVRWRTRVEDSENALQYARAREDYERARLEWERSWVCLQCGHIYRG